MASKKTKKHTHRWKLSGRMGRRLETVTFRCTTCSEEAQRPMTATEKRFEQTDLGMRGAKPSDLHAVSHDFDRRFCAYKKVKRKLGKRWITVSEPNGWKWIGYPLMQRVARWAKKYPDHVQIVSVDDAYFAGSDLVLIESKSKSQYMGTSVYYIPQCTGESPVQFFLYPSHRKGLIAALQAIAKASRPVIVAENARLKKSDAFWSKARP